LRTVFFFFFFFSGVLLSACSASSSPSTADAGSSGGGSDAAPGGAEGGTGDTWANYASDFVTTYCVSCHNENDAKGRNYKDEANVQKEKLEIRCGVAVSQDPSWSCAAFPPAKQFPIGGGAKPSDAERARFVAWITAGAK
jgi:hypothetical protein